MTPTERALTAEEWDALRRAADAPWFVETSCCSWNLGAHYGEDGEVAKSSLVPPHEPVIKPDSGVVMVKPNTMRRLLADAERAARAEPPDVDEVASRFHDARYGVFSVHDGTGSPPFVEPVVACDYCRNAAERYVYASAQRRAALEAQQ